MRSLACVLTLCFLTASSAAAETLLKDGKYESYEGGAAIVNGNDVLLTIAADGCLGQAEGMLTAAEDGALTFSGTEESEGFICEMSITPKGKFGFIVEQGEGCSAYHGASCGFDGYYQRTQ